METHEVWLTPYLVLITMQVQVVQPGAPLPGDLFPLYGSVRADSGWWVVWRAEIDLVKNCLVPDLGALYWIEGSWWQRRPQIWKMTSWRNWYSSPYGLSFGSLVRVWWIFPNRFVYFTYHLYPFVDHFSKGVPMAFQNRYVSLLQGGAPAPVINWL